eukprot:1158961-Pelagomonas_calceolata.AAC.2
MRMQPFSNTDCFSIFPLLHRYTPVSKVLSDTREGGSQADRLTPSQACLKVQRERRQMIEMSSPHDKSDTVGM